ncbi:conserved Plasmodium protein, unknown function, partial [Plasmodium malariae]
YALLNILIVEAVSEIKLNNFLSISNFLQILEKYEVNFNMYFWVLYDSYINIYKKYCAHAELVKYFNNNNRSEMCDFDCVRKIKYNYCNKKKFYIRRLLIFSVCVLLSFICKSILDFFVTYLNCSYENVFSSLCFFFFSNSKQRKVNDYMHLNLQKSIYFNLFLSLSFVLQYIPLSVQYLNLFKIIKKVKKYKIILAFCLNYICGINLPFYIFYELQNMPLSLLNDFFSFDKEILNLCSNNYELSNSISANTFEDIYFDESDLKINEKEHIEWINKHGDYNMSNDTLRFFKNKKINKNIYKRFHNKAEKNKNMNLIRLMIKLHLNSILNAFTFYDFKNASVNILSYLTNNSLQDCYQNNNNSNFFKLIFSHFVNYVSSFWYNRNYEINEYQKASCLICSKHEMGSVQNCRSEIVKNRRIIKWKAEHLCEKRNDHIKETDVLLNNYYNLFKVSTDLLFFGEHKLMEKNIFEVLLNIMEIHYSHLLIILPIFTKHIFNLLTYDLKIYLINIFFYIFTRTDMYKIRSVSNVKNKTKNIKEIRMGHRMEMTVERKTENEMGNFRKINKNNFTEQKDNDVFEFNKKDNINVNNTNSKDFLMRPFDCYSTNNYFEVM